MPEMPLVLWSLRYPRRCRTGGAVGAPPGDELRPVAVGPAALLPTPDAFIAQAKSTKWKRALRILSYYFFLKKVLRAYIQLYFLIILPRVQYLFVGAYEDNEALFLSIIMLDYVYIRDQQRK